MQPLSCSLVATLLLALAAAPAEAATHTYVFSLSGTQEVPAVATAGTGSCTVVLDDVTRVVTVNGTYSAMSSNVILAHIHGPAPVGMNAGVLVSLTPTGGTSGSISGSGTLSAANVTNLLNGLCYVNVHTVNHSGGEIRGQVVCESMLQASVSARNGSGANLAGFAATNTPVIGTTWNLTVDLVTPPGGVASAVALGAGGPIQLPTNYGEVLALPPYTILVAAGGSQAIPIPDDCTLVGLVASFQAASIAPGKIRLQNALDATFGTF